MEHIFASGLVADIVLAVMAAEALGMMVLKGRDWPASRVAAHLAGLCAGAFLVLALRAALTGTGWPAIALFLSLSFLAHAAELILRWRSAA